MAAPLTKALAAAAGGPATDGRCAIDLVEAEGWRLEHVVHRFVATKVQTSVLMGADLLGGDRIEGDARYLYLFRRAAAAAGGADRV